jgi:lipopolysaccharide export system protein LptA
VNRGRRLELVVLAFGVVFVALLAYSFRPGRRPSSRGADSLPRPPSAGEDGLPMTVSKGFDYTETVGGKPIFRIQAERTVGFGPAAGQIPNSYSLEGVSLTLYPEQGQGAPVTVRADKAQYDHRTNDAVLSGNVRWTDEKGALGETAKVEFHPSSKGGELLVPSPVHFSRGTFNVEAKSGRYDVSKRELALEGPIRGSGTGEGSAGLSSIASDRARYRREEGVIELAGSVSGSSRGGDRVDCDAMTLKTEQEGNHIEWARAEGNVRGVLAAAPGATPGAGPAVSAVERRYFAKTGALFFAPDGAARSLALTGSPARVEEGNRKVEADTIDVAFEGGHAAAAHARGKVRFDSPENRAESDTANVSFAASGEIASLELSGNVTTAGEGRSAKADKVVQVPARGLWVLTGGTGGSATAETEGSKVSADRIEMDRNRRTLEATGNARAVFVPVKSKERPPTLVGDSSKPTFGKAARMVFDDAAKTATLSGGGTLWQGASSIFGDDITLNDAQRMLVAVGHTRTVVSPEPGEAAKDARDRGPSVVTARRVIYRDAEGAAVFEDGVLVTRGAWRASAQKATATFGAARKIDRVELTGDVTLSDSSTGRKGKADKALDLPGEDRMVLHGAPAWVTDAEGNRVAGAVLTITEKGKRVEVTAPEGGKTETIHKTKA